MQNCQHKLEEDEVFSIKASEEDIKEYLSVIINNPHSNKIERIDLKNIETIFVFTQNDCIKFYIQRIAPSFRIEKSYLAFATSKGLATIQREIYIPILNQTHIYYNDKTQKIYFFKFTDLEKVFPSFAKYYREANEEDLKIFTNAEKYNFLDVTLDEKSLNSLNKTRLRKIAQIVDTLDEIEENIGNYYKYAEKYKRNITSNNQFKIKEAGDIDIFHSVVFEKYFTSEVSQKEQREATAYKGLK